LVLRPVSSTTLAGSRQHLNHTDYTEKVTNGSRAGAVAAPPRDQRRLHNLDGVRAVAVLAVFVSHIPLLGRLAELRGGRGVEWFFALSGFLVTTLALREEAALGRMRIRAFYVRRAFRILPLFAIALVVTVAADLTVFRSANSVSGWRDYWPFYLTMTQDVPFLLGRPNVRFSHSWSLGVEEKFYLLWPLIAFAAWSRRLRPYVAPALAAMLALAIVWGAGSDPARVISPYLPILFGALAAMYLHAERRWRAAALTPSPILLMLVIASVVPAPDAVVANRYYEVGYALLIAITVAMLGVRAPFARLDNSSLVWVGRRSYAIYLFHPLFLAVTSRVVVRFLDPAPVVRVALIALPALAATLLTAALVHRIVEEPLIEVGRRVAARQSGDEAVRVRT
jgi:peptidoglycan/LPS O-acetylase OafA/YrhL